jgi:Protein of Unknown function (DUF2784)
MMKFCLTELPAVICDTFPVVFRILADATVLLHLLFVLFAVLGGVLVVRWWWVAWAHVPAAIWGAWVEFAGWQMPAHTASELVPTARRRSYLQNEFRRTLRLSDSLPTLTFARGSVDIGWAVVLLNAAIYVLIFHRRAR